MNDHRRARTALTTLDRAHVLLDTEGHPNAWMVAVDIEGEPLALADLRARVASRVPAAEIYRSRLAERVARPPRFEVVGEVDITTHVRQVAVANRDGLFGLIAARMESRMPRTIPLWDILLVDRLDSGEQTVLLRVHHCVSDGMRAAAFTALFLDIPAGSEREYHRLMRDERFEPTDLGPAPGPVDTLTALPRYVRAVRDGRRRAAALGMSWQECRRQVTAFSIPVRHLRASAVECGASTTDYILAAAAVAYSRVFATRRGPRNAVRTMVPVSLDRELRMNGNAASMALLRLSAEPDDVRGQLEVLRAEHTAADQFTRARAFARATMDLRLLPWPVQAAVAGATTMSSWDLGVTINPGFASRRTLMGRGVQAVWPFPVPVRQEALVGALIFRDRATFGVVIDPRTHPAGAVNFAEQLHELLVGAPQPVTDTVAGSGGGLR